MFCARLINVVDLRKVFFIIVFSFLFKHFTVVDKPKSNLNFYKHSNFTSTFSRTNYIDFIEKCFLKHKTLRKSLEESHITLHSKKDLNLRSVKGPYTLCTDFFGSIMM